MMNSSCTLVELAALVLQTGKAFGWEDLAARGKSDLLEYSASPVAFYGSIYVRVELGSFPGILTQRPIITFKEGCTTDCSNHRPPC